MEKQKLTISTGIIDKRNVGVRGHLHNFIPVKEEGFLDHTQHEKDVLYEIVKQYKVKNFIRIGEGDFQLHQGIRIMNYLDPPLMNYGDIKSKLIYCDGDHKLIDLFNFKTLLSRGDIIMTHDYWDGVRQIRDIPQQFLLWDVTPDNIGIYDDDIDFERFPEDMFKETRIIGWRRIK